MPKKEHKQRESTIIDVTTSLLKPVTAILDTAVSIAKDWVKIGFGSTLPASIFNAVADTLLIPGRVRKFWAEHKLQPLGDKPAKKPTRITPTRTQPTEVQQVDQAAINASINAGNDAQQADCSLPYFPSQFTRPVSHLEQIEREDNSRSV